MYFINNLTSKFSKIFILSALSVLYLVVFWFLFFTKGIYVDGHFYKKSANLTVVTYTCKSPLAGFEKIVLEKQLDTAVIKLDDSYTITVNSAGGVSVEGNGGIDSTLPDVRWDLIADQSAESIRGFGEKPWIAVLTVIVLMFFVKKFSTQIYIFFNRNKAAGEKYYIWIDRLFLAVFIAGLIYLIIPL